jgi:hypothetical protein
MKNVLYLILALILVMLVWGIVRALLAKVLGIFFTIGMILLFCFLVYTVFKMMTGKEKNII